MVQIAGEKLGDNARSRSRLARLAGIAIVLGALTSTTGCMTHRHTMGDGPRGAEVRTHGTWYAFWGFLPLNDEDSRAFVGGETDYRVRTGFRARDVVTNLVTAPLGFVRRTTTIEK